MRIDEGMPSAPIPDWSREHKITLTLLYARICCQIPAALHSIRYIKKVPKEVGAGTKVLGLLTVGDHAVIGANAVLFYDMPFKAVAIPRCSILPEYRAA